MVTQGHIREANLCPGSSREMVPCGQELPGQVLRWRQGHLQGKVKRKELVLFSALPPFDPEDP